MIFHHGDLRKMSQLRESCWILRVTVGRHNETMVFCWQWMTIAMDDIAQKVENGKTWRNSPHMP
jgi:hypothetical protein